MKKAQLSRKESDEWLCSSTYKPDKTEVVQKVTPEDRKPKKKKKLAVVVPKTVKLTPSVRFERVENGFKRIESARRMSQEKEGRRSEEGEEEEDVQHIASTSTAVCKTVKRTPSIRFERVENGFRRIESMRRLSQGREGRRNEEGEEEDDVQHIQSTSTSVCKTVKLTPTVRFERVENGFRRIESMRRLSQEGQEDVQRIASTSTAVFHTPTPTRKLSTLKIISPILPKSGVKRQVSLMRQSPEQVFASLTPKRRKSIELVKPVVRRNQPLDFDDRDPFQTDEEEDDEKSDCSEVSNVFDCLSPIKQLSPPKSKFSTNFITGYEAQFTQFESVEERQSQDLFEDDPFSIYEDSEMQEAKDLDASPVKIEVSPEKKNTARKTLRFEVEEDEEEPLEANSLFREYAIDVETVGFLDESSCLPDQRDPQTQRYVDAESCALVNHPSSLPDSLDDLQNDEICERDDLCGLAARFATVMMSKANERRLLVSDALFSAEPKKRMERLDVHSAESAFGMTILSTSPSSVTINRSSSIRHLAASPAAAVDPAPPSVSASAAAPPLSAVYSIGALSAAPSLLIRSETSSEPLRVFINPALVGEGAL